MDWRIIDKSLQGTLTDAEKSQLNEWLEEAASHRKLYEKIWNKKKYDPGEERFAAWRKTFESDLDQRLSKARRLKWLRWGSVAAAVFLLLVGGAEWYRWKQPTVQPSCLVAYQEPDRTKVRLMTATGEVVDLSAVAGQDTLLIDGVKVAKEQKMLAYSQTQPLPAGEKEVENRVEVPRGAEFCLSLADGSRVWLNSDSRLTYPVAFSKDSREVKLEGEAYFEVTHHENKPFIVHTAGMKVKVLGAEFNMNTRNTAGIQTTLVKGKVVVEGEHFTAVVLNPGELATADIKTGKVDIVPVNVRKYIAWRYGEYFFEEATMEEILNELSLWYDVEIVYRQEQLRKEKFSGCLRRSESIVSLLNKIEQTTYVHFSVEPNRIIVNY